MVPLELADLPEYQARHQVNSNMIYKNINVKPYKFHTNNINLPSFNCPPLTVWSIKPSKSPKSGKTLQYTVYDTVTGSDIDILTKLVYPTYRNAYTAQHGQIQLKNKACK